MAISTAECVIIDRVSPETESRIVRAGERYAAADAALKAARTELVDAMLAAKDEDPAASTEKIARLTPLSNTQVFRMLRAARES
jgi:hypothetical protein